MTWRQRLGAWLCRHGWHARTIEAVRFGAGIAPGKEHVTIECLICHHVIFDGLREAQS